MAKELSKEHEVSVASFEDGLMTEKIKPFARVLNIKEMSEEFDLAIVGQNDCVPFVKAKKKIFISHGTTLPSEVPPEKDYILVAVSEEVRDYYKRNAKVILNPVDIETFSSNRESSHSIKNVLFVSSYASTDILRQVCYEEGLNYLQIKNEWNIEIFMNWADMVFSTARGCYEAMSCAKEVIIFNDREPDGIPLAEGFVRERYYEVISHNCSGRKERIVYDKEFIKKEILAKYSEEGGSKNREIIMKHHNVKDICNQLLNL
ncbi:MAG: hypothetical protein ACTSSH_00065 [Candidatus Heimdallarchaeota archaeon]